MKQTKIICWILAVLLLTTACHTTIPSNQPSNTTTTVAPTTQRVDDPSFAWIKQLPKMDGSTSTIPLEAGIRAALFGISHEEAEAQVIHNSTYGSYEKLLNKECDLIFTVQMSQKQIQNAAERGVELEQVPVAAEGFVFVVNAQNPVDTLTQQQLRDIYAGKITNWKEVGGNDAPIAAYQRNETSGSQNYIKIFMGDTPLMEPITEFVPGSMGQLMDAVAYYDNAENAIGYSVYAYAADMYGNGDEIKFIHVDGVEPTKATMADGSYPLLSYNYMVFNKEQPTDSAVRKLVNWVLTDEGQTAVSNAGYVPLSDKINVTELTPSFYDAVGTGMEKPTDYAPSPIEYYVPTWLSENSGIEGLVDKALEQEINSYIRARETDVDKASLEVINGYLSIKFKEESLFYDLYTGKRLEFTDLYFKGVELGPLFRSSAQRSIQIERTLQEEWDNPSDNLDPMAFGGLKKDHTYFSLTSITLPRDIYNFNVDVIASTRHLYEHQVFSIARDMQGVFQNGKVQCRWTRNEAYTIDKRIGEQYVGHDLSLLDADHYPDCPTEKINAAVTAAFNDFTSEEALRAWYKKLTGKSGDFTSLVGYGGSGCTDIMGRYFLFSFSKQLGAMAEVPYGMLKYFDRETGEEVPYDHFFKEGWEEAATWYTAESEDGGYYISYYNEAEKLAQAPDIQDARPMYFAAENKGYILTLAPNSGKYPLVTAIIPFDFVDWSA